jgi:phosphonate metabolism protein PhnN/1,5-bisphosphokinase (PRPP-forming)
VPATIGTLVLVVGPSGAGKDSIIAGAASQLHGDLRFVFARRAITRPREAGGESHLALSPFAFDAARSRGGFLLHWRAHGLDYGIPATLAADRAAGRIVVANASRTMVELARMRLAPVRIVQVLSARAVLAARLAQRRRESAADIDRRLERAVAAEIEPSGDVMTILNDEALESAVGQFVLILRELAAQPLVSPAFSASR